MKYAHLEKETNKIQGWYSEDIHGTWIEPIYETKVIQEEIQDDDGNIVQEKSIQDILVKDGFYDISNIPTPNIEVTEEQWQEAINISANFYDEATKTFIVKDFKTAEEIEAQRVLSIKRKAQSLIVEKYPLEKQSSAQLGLYGDVYLTELKAYIFNIVRISNEAEANGTALEDIKWEN